MNGQGKMTYPNGDEYTGTWYKNKVRRAAGVHNNFQLLKNRYIFVEIDPYSDYITIS